MVYDDDTRACELLAEAVSIMSKTKDNVDRYEGEPIFKLLGIAGEKEDLDAEWCTWTDRLLSSLEELHEVVKRHDVSLAEIESSVDELRIWYQKRPAWRVVVVRTADQGNGAENLGFLKIFQKRRSLLMLRKRSSWRMNRLLMSMLQWKRLFLKMRAKSSRRRGE